MLRDGKNGFVVDPGDESALAQRMITLLEDQDLCLRMGDAGHVDALDRFEPGVVAQRTVAAYREALSGSRRIHGREDQ